MGLNVADNTHTVSERVGSYSGTHELRRRYIEMAIEYLKSQKEPEKSYAPKKRKLDDESQPNNVATPDTECKEDEGEENGEDEEEEEDDEDGEYNSVEESAARAIKLLQSWITFQNIRISLFPTPINYESISENVTEDMVRWKLAGLLHFVNCSDCEGAWTYGQCIDILDFFNAMIAFKKKDTYDSEREKWEFDHMVALRDVYQYAIDNKGYVIRC